MENKGNPEEVKEEIPIQQPTKHNKKHSVLTKNCAKSNRRSKITFMRFNFIFYIKFSWKLL